MIVQTLADLVKGYLANIEGRLNQETPAAPMAYNSVIAFLEGAGDYVAHKYAVDRYLAAFWHSAQGADLDELGKEYNLPRRSAQAWAGTATFPASNGTLIPYGTAFVNQTNGMTYLTTEAVTSTGSSVTLSLQCQLPTDPATKEATGGAASNLGNGAALSIVAAIGGAGLVATVTATTSAGVDRETDPKYRTRGLALVQSTPSGSNLSSYRLWCLSVPGIAMAYPYSGAPSGTSYPGQRTIYVECDTDVQVDGVPGGSWTGSTSTAVGLLGQVANAIKYNSLGTGQETAGLVDVGLFVEPIYRTAMHVQITTLDVPSGQLVACQADILAAVTAYFLKVRPFCFGVDPLYSRNDQATNTALSSVIQTILVKYGATVQTIAFGATIGAWVSKYVLSPGQKLKLGTVSYV